MNELQLKQKIKQDLQRFERGILKNAAISLLDTLGYRSDIGTGIEFESPEDFLEQFDPTQKLNRDKALIEQWQSVEVLFQLTGDDIKETEQLGFIFEASNEAIDNTIIESYLFLALKLRGQAYSRTALSNITREINKLTPMPAMVLFQHGQTLTLSVINRRLHKRDESRDVLEKVTLIKDIAFANPHRAHIEILFDLSLEQLYQKHGFTNFVELHRAWQKTLDSSELNKRFFREVANWYFWAVEQVTFPKDAGEDVETRNATSVIRLITRLIFVWFLKEKGLIPDALFNQAKLQDILNFTDIKESTYYKAILQNLFFATLNQKMNTEKEPDNRKFRSKAKQSGQRDQHYMVHNVYRYQDYFKQPDEALHLFESIPFLNGGLFECLDKPDKDNPRKVLRIDGFSDRSDNELVVPDFLFFADERDIDLNETYGTRNKRYKVRGILNILDSYKFTINENTPIEEEVALDPELLGKVFENLLAAYNPETGATARKQTGSFYTPREIVNYMVDESLIAYLESKLNSDDNVNDRLRHLIAYNDEPHRFSEQEVERLIEAIDTMKILDPACGSGAFPMGILHKLVYILGKLDPGNERWKARQIAKANEIPDSTIRETVVAEIEKAFESNELDYGRKLYLIENCIYGVDIQPIAVQIAKLRFFISLVVDQKIDDTQENRGIIPLPNLETKFVAANTLIGIDTQLSLRTSEIAQKEKELADVRRRHFTARTPGTKKKYRNRDAQIRAEISELLKKSGLPSETTEKLAFWDPYDQNASADFFDPEWMFGIADGFDVVIGNPPYIRQESIRPLKPLLKKQGYEVYNSTSDIYTYFYEKSYRILKNSGICTFITSNKWTRAKYGEKLRKFFKEKVALQQLIDFGGFQVFESTVDTNILIFHKISDKVPAEHQLNITLVEEDYQAGGSIDNYIQSKAFKMPQKALNEKAFTFADETTLKIKRKIEESGTPLKGWNINIYRGVITGFNEAFIIDNPTKERLCEEDSKSIEVIKPILRGRDIYKNYYVWAKMWMIIIPSGWTNENRGRKSPEAFFKETYPAIYNYFEEIGDKIKRGQIKAKGKGLYGRDDQGDYWWELRPCDYYSELEKPKIVYPDINYRLTFCLDENNKYLSNTAYFLRAKDCKYMLAVLNSSLLNWYYQFITSQLGAKGIRHFSIYIEQLPVPQISEVKQKPFINLVDKILTAKRDDPDTSALEQEIDQLVYGLYDLTPEEIAIVEGKANQPKDEPSRDEPQEIK